MALSRVTISRILDSRAACSLVGVPLFVFLVSDLPQDVDFQSDSKSSSLQLASTKQLLKLLRITSHQLPFCDAFLHSCTAVHFPRARSHRAVSG